MEKQKLYFYETIMSVDVSFMAPNHREPPERMFGFADQDLMQHNIRFRPRRGDGGIIPPDILCTEEEIHWGFTEAREKMVSRPGENPKDFTPDARHRIMRPKLTKVKFRLMAPEEITEEVKKRAKLIRMRPIDTLAGAKVEEKKEAVTVK